MRSRLGLALLVLAIPTLAAAQRTRTRIGGTPPERVDKPPMAPGIPDARLYTRYRMSRFSFEQYPMFMALQTSGFLAKGIPTNYAVLGDGTNLNFRIAPSLALTSDLTTGFLGGPFSLGSIELGSRVMPWTATRVRPFADARMNWAYTTGSNGLAGMIPIGQIAQSFNGDRTTSSGRGRSVGVGAEMNVARNVLLTTTLSAAHYDMTRRELSTREEWGYDANAYRLTIGVRYAPGRWTE